MTTAWIIKKITGKNADDTPIYKSKGSAFILFETQVGAYKAVDANPVIYKVNKLNEITKKVEEEIVEL